MRRVLWLVGLLRSALPAGAEGFGKGPIPDWVEVLDIPASPPELVALSQDGVYYPLSDAQVRWEGEDQI
ncbi:MAG: hypothetical protein ACRC14_12720, partial [Paracoccaceae bacterium]